MTRDEKVEHLGELARKDQAIRAREILRFVLKIKCFNMMLNNLMTIKFVAQYLMF